MAMDAAAADRERTKRILRPVLVLLAIALVIISDPASSLSKHDDKRDGRSNVRIKELVSVYDSVDKAHYYRRLTFPVERQCKTSDFIQPVAQASELVSLWSDLLHKFTFANEEMVPDEAVDVLARVATRSGAYMKLPFVPITLLLLYAIASLVYLVLIPVIGCIIFRISDAVWTYCISIAIRKLGRLVILAFYKSKIQHIKQTKPEQLGTHHFRIPKYFRNDDDPEELFDDPQNEEAAHKRQLTAQQQLNDSSDSDFEIEARYKGVAGAGGIGADGEERGDDEAGPSEEQQKLLRKATRRAFKRAQGRRQSIKLQLGDGEDQSTTTSDDSELAAQMKNFGDIWDLQMAESGMFKDKPLDAAEIQRARKTLLQELKEERLKKKDEVRHGDLEKAVGKHGGV